MNETSFFFSFIIQTSKSRHYVLFYMSTFLRRHLVRISFLASATATGATSIGVGQLELQKWIALDKISSDASIKLPESVCQINRLGLQSKVTWAKWTCSACDESTDQLHGREGELQREVKKVILLFRLNHHVAARAHLLDIFEDTRDAFAGFAVYTVL